MSKENKVKQYTNDIQKLYLSMLLSDAETYARCRNIYDPNNFSEELRKPSRFVQDFVEQYKVMPTIDQVRAETGYELDTISGLPDEHYDWLLNEFEQFSKHKFLERAILASADLLEKGYYTDVETKIKEAVQIGLTKNLGLDYFEDPKSRLEAIKNNNGQVSTGWKAIDDKLYGGMNRGELNIWAGGSGSGKSLFLQNIALNWVLQGLNVVYVTLELSEELCAMRLDSMLTGTSTKEVFKQIENVEMKVKMMSKKAGALQVKYMPSQSTANDFRSFLKEYQIQTGRKVDAFIVDYLDLCMPNSKRVSPSDLFVKDKYVSEELRNLAKENNMLLVTASQLNRAAVEEIEFDHSHIAGGISKINTADNVIGIFTTRAMRERGRYQIQFMKTRSSSGVGQKVDLEFNIDSLRITDCDEETSGNQSSAGSIFNQIKPKSTIIDSTTGEITPAKTSSADQMQKINQILKRVKQDDLG
jgi:archaellum biogenesis ATPase FlaH